MEVLLGGNEAFAGHGEGVVGLDGGFVGGAHGGQGGAGGFGAEADVARRVADESPEGGVGVHVGVELGGCDAGVGRGGHAVSFRWDDE